MLSKIIPNLNEITPKVFLETFEKIIELKESVGIKAILDNSPDLFDRAKLYGIRYRNDCGIGLQIFRVDQLKTS